MVCFAWLNRLPPPSIILRPKFPSESTRFFHIRELLDGRRRTRSGWWDRDLRSGKLGAGCRTRGDKKFWWVQLALDSFLSREREVAAARFKQGDYSSIAQPQSVRSAFTQKRKTRTGKCIRGCPSPTFSQSQKPVSSCPESHEIQGYMPMRNEFCVESENEAEHSIKDLEFCESDTPLDKGEPCRKMRLLLSCTLTPDQFQRTQACHAVNIQFRSWQTARKEKDSSRVRFAVFIICVMFLVNITIKMFIYN